MIVAWSGAELQINEWLKLESLGKCLKFDKSILKTTLFQSEKIYGI